MIRLLTSEKIKLAMYINVPIEEHQQIMKKNNKSHKTFSNGRKKIVSYADGSSEHSQKKL
ncbi:conserved hypothetical protein [Ricinus communis]|uniref:Uncharacterized protein n=1 Tax=Ricinus communis TaxID=3988 RepID=B9SW44_RICCO|nr:conserved hypothetical protein [Ricinus communis]